MPGIQRLGLHAKLERDHATRPTDALWTAVCASVLVLIALILGYTVHRAFVFVSLGPIIYEVVERPMAPASQPRNILIGNGVALLVAVASLEIFGLSHAGSTLVEGVTPARIGAVIVAVAVCGALLAALDAMHPPAGSTLLLVALGIVTGPTSLVMIYVGVVIITAASVLLNRVLGVPVPLWSERAEHAVASARGEQPPRVQQRDREPDELGSP